MGATYGHTRSPPFASRSASSCRSRCCFARRWPTTSPTDGREPRGTRSCRPPRFANAHGFIDRLPLGYDTILGERGDTLSGGQRQRIAIARAIVRNTRILLLDEPSAALDPESEDLIFSGLAHLMKECTSITIAHRLRTVQDADVIFVLDDGVIAEHGTHEELIAARGLYARLHAIQFRPDATSVEGRVERGGVGRLCRAARPKSRGQPRFKAMVEGEAG